MQGIVALASNADVAITSEMLEPILDYITGNIAVIIPVGIAVMGIMIGIALVPRIIKRFTKA